MYGLPKRLKCRENQVDLFSAEFQSLFTSISPAHLLRFGDNTIQLLLEICYSYLSHSDINLQLLPFSNSKRVDCMESIFSTLLSLLYYRITIILQKVFFDDKYLPNSIVPRDLPTTHSNTSL